MGTRRLALSPGRAWRAPHASSYRTWPWNPVAGRQGWGQGLSHDPGPVAVSGPVFGSCSVATLTHCRLSRSLRRAQRLRTGLQVVCVPDLPSPSLHLPFHLGIKELVYCCTVIETTVCSAVSQFWEKQIPKAVPSLSSFTCKGAELMCGARVLGSKPSSPPDKTGSLGQAT